MVFFELRVDSYQEGLSFPPVTHVFRGTSAAKAKAKYHAHLTLDAFLNGCKKGLVVLPHEANIICHNVVHRVRKVRV